MLKRITNWVKSLFHEETPEEQDERIHKTIKTWKENADKDEFERLELYYDLCEAEFRKGTRSANVPTNVDQEHLDLWNDIMPQIKNKDNILKAWTIWHEAHLLLAALYHFDATEPNGPIFGKHVDLRPAKWLKDLATEEKIIKAFTMRANAQQYQV